MAAGNTTITGFVSIAGTLAAGNTTIAGTTTTTGQVSQGVASQYMRDVQSNTNIGDNTVARLVYSFPKASYRSGKLLLQATNAIANTNQIAEMIITQNGATAYMSTYGIVASPYNASNEAPLGTFTSNINNANVEISMTQVYSNTAVTVVAQLIQ